MYPLHSERAEKGENGKQPVSGECLRALLGTHCHTITKSIHKSDLLGAKLTVPMVCKQSKLLTVHFGVALLKTKGLLSLPSPLFDCMEESPFGLL